MKRADQVELDQLRQRDPHTWTVADVAKYLDLIGLGEYKISFIENDVSGSEFLELTMEEAEKIGVRKMGPRKQLQAAIKKLGSYGAGGGAGGGGDSSSDTGSASGSASGSDASGSKTPSKVVVKGKWDGAWIMITVDSAISLSDLKKKVRRETRTKVELSYKDADGDVVQLRRTSHLATAIRAARGKPLKLEFKRADGDKKKKGAKGPEEKTEISPTEAAVFEGLNDGVAVIDEVGKILFMNKAASLLFAAAPSQVIGQNIKVLMLQRDAESHDFYLWRYVSQREPRIVGKPGRMVVARRFDGTSVAIHLSVNESKATNGKTIFVGTVRPAKNDGANAPEYSADIKERYRMMENIMQSVIVINTQGIIQYVNKRLVELTGYANNELVGKNIKMMMPDPFRSEHDGYLKRYLDTGESKIIGNGREVVMLHKDQSVIPVNLTVNTQGRGADVEYVGVIEVVKESEQEANLLASQRQVLESLAVPAVLIDEKGSIQVFNGAAQKMFGFTANDTLGRNVRMLMPEPDKSKHDGYLRSYLKRGPNAKQMSTVIGTGRDVIGAKKDGSQFPIHLSVTEHIDSAGNRFFSSILVPK